MRSPPQRYAIYTRQSTVSAGKVLSSCDAQFSICEEFMQSYGSSVAWIGERLDDVGRSGGNTERHALQRLLTLVRDQRIDQLVVYRLDRLARNLRDSFTLLETLNEANVKLVIVTAPEMGMAATDRFILNLMASFAEFERDMIGSRIAETRAYLRQHGRRLAGKLPYGYDSDPHTKQLVINSEEAPNVEEMFRMAADGMSPRDIAATANSRGWRTKRTITRRTARESGGGLWTPRQVLTLLSNQVYVGQFSDGRGMRPGCHQAIVTLEIFERAQEKIAARRSVDPAKKARAEREKPQFWPLRSKIRCPECARPMSTHVTQKGIIGLRHYRCRSFAGGRPPCKGSAFPAYEIEKLVSEIIGKMSFLDSNSNRMAQESFHRFQQAWIALDYNSRSLLLPTVVKELGFNRATSSLRIDLDPASP